MKPFRLTLGAMAGWIAIIGFDLAVLTRAYQLGRASGSAEPYLIGFGVVLLLTNLLGLQLGRAVVRLRRVSPAEWLSEQVTPAVMLALYLLAMAVPILAILFLYPRAV